MELVRATEAAAIRAVPFIGHGDKNAADKAAVDAMRAFLSTVNFEGVVVIGEGEKDEAPMLFNGEIVGYAMNVMNNGVQSRSGQFRVEMLGYRDSGMLDSPANTHPDCFHMAPLDEAVGRLVSVIRREKPVCRPAPNIVLVTRYEDVKAVFRDNILFSPANALEKITPATPEVMAVLARYGFAMNRTMVNEDEPDHMERRRLLMDAFLPERLATFEPMVRALARQYMDRFIDQGRADLVREMFYEIPLNIALKFLGVPDDGAEQLRQFAVAHTLNTWGRPSPEEQLEIAHNVGRFWQTAQNILDGMMARPDGEGWMYETIRQHLAHPDIVPESYMRSMMMAILAAAHETTSNATANAFLTLLTHRKAWDDICANPALIPNAVEECLRVAGSVVAWRRRATADTVLGGCDIVVGAAGISGGLAGSCRFDGALFERVLQLNVTAQAALSAALFPALAASGLGVAKGCSPRLPTPECRPAP